ncbi:hypothetical protein ACFPIJ_46955 [Dactylosporangium cerinum]|uniref:Uncharacterized protein n=1 Tax=Dactylosporangium cerinum TaxID=1434730 RepID=A0ABV9WAG0_9ACTN
MAWDVHRSQVTRHTRQEAGLAYLAVALFIDLPEGARYIEFQLADEPDDRSWGYCVVDGPPTRFQPGDGIEELVTMMSSHACMYGGVTSARLDGSNLVLVFDEEAARLFGWPRELPLHLNITHEDRDALRAGLAEVLAVGPNGKAPTIVL